MKNKFSFFGILLFLFALTFGNAWAEEPPPGPEPGEMRSFVQCKIIRSEIEITPCADETDLGENDGRTIDIHADNGIGNDPLVPGYSKNFGSSGPSISWLVKSHRKSKIKIESDLVNGQYLKLSQGENGVNIKCHFVVTTNGGFNNIIPTNVEGNNIVFNSGAGTPKTSIRSMTNLHLVLDDIKVDDEAKPGLRLFNVLVTLNYVD